MINKFSQTGVPIDELISILKQIANQKDVHVIKHHIENLRSRVQSPEHSRRLGEILGALNVPNILGQGQLVKDPQSGKPYPNNKTCIEEYIQELEGQKKVSTNQFNFYKFSTEETPPKKKKRGNPFRVLMGKIGKLLDHGLEKRDIVRYLLKENIWDEKTIENAIGIVKEYNKKKHRKKQVQAQTLIANGEVWPRFPKDYSKRSTGELLASICWLNSLDNMKDDVDDRGGVKTMIRTIKSELINRGMDEKELNKLLK